MSDQPTLAQRVSSCFTQLSSVAADLNTVSDDLGKFVAEIDSALKKLNLGLDVWVKVCGWDDQYRGGSAFWSEDIGFAKVKGKWGIALRRVEGDYNCPDDEAVDEWLFGDAPRALRLQAIDKLPEMIEKLNKEAVAVAGKIRKKLPEVRDIAIALNPAHADSRKLNAWGGLSPEGESGWITAARAADALKGTK